MERVFFLKNVGPVLIKKRKGSKRITVRVRSDDKIYMTIPYFVSWKEAEKTLVKKQEWILNAVKKQSLIPKQKEILLPENLPQNLKHDFSVIKSVEEPLSFKIYESLCEIRIPDQLPLQSDLVQNTFKKAVIETLRVEAKNLLIQRCRYLSIKHGFTINQIRVKNMKTRWGSCSSLKNINLNIHILRIPEPLRDYVIYHELVHTIHLNHSKAFWSELEKYVKNPRAVSAEMRKYGYLLSEFE